MKISGLNVDFNSVSFDPQGHQIWVPPSKRVISAAVDYSIRTVADRHRLAALLTTFAAVQTSITLNDREI